MTLFKQGVFQLHSGTLSDWKIDCDELSEDDLMTLATVAYKQIGPWGPVVGVPTGGLRFALACTNYSIPLYSQSGPLLIVDDVLTTGASMEEMRKKHSNIPAIGLVIFARGNPPDWVHALFVMKGSA